MGCLLWGCLECALIVWLTYFCSVCLLFFPCLLLNVQLWPTLTKEYPSVKLANTRAKIVWFTYKNTTGYQKTMFYTRKEQKRQEKPDIFNLFRRFLTDFGSISTQHWKMPRSGIFTLRGKKLKMSCFSCLFCIVFWYPVVFLFSDSLWCFCKKTRQFLFLCLLVC